MRMCMCIAQDNFRKLFNLPEREARVRHHVILSVSCCYLCPLLPGLLPCAWPREGLSRQACCTSSLIARYLVWKVGKFTCSLGNNFGQLHVTSAHLCFFPPIGKKARAFHL